ncbi:hypothetical protein CJ030_MR2G000397 [Morella rubra]|uniref:Secreted protein n=1 Tax=Morella rubra TaxID=262757 RepID=A0A6A1WG33_9ROSI|nr:hypothetical protein CJ030_MR2G000397 [Morella rubra]
MSCHGMSLAGWLACQAWALLGHNALSGALSLRARALMPWHGCGALVACGGRVKGAHGCHWCLISAPIFPRMVITTHVVTEDPFNRADIT